MSYAITTKGQVTLPKRFRESLGVQPGEAVDFRFNDRGEVVVEKSRPLPTQANRFDQWRGAWRGGLTTDQIMAMTRGEAD